MDVIDRYPAMRVWVAHNKTVPLEILEILRHDADEKVQGTVRQKRSWARAHPEDSTRLTGLANTRSKIWKSKLKKEFLRKTRRFMFSVKGE